MQKTARRIEPVFNKLVGLTSESLPNRLVIITGDKGGVGKSTFARGLLHTYLSNEEFPIVFEADKSNPNIERFYGNSGLTIEKTDVTDANKLDKFVDKLEAHITSVINEDVINDSGEITSQSSKILIDLPAQSNQFLFKFIEDMDLFSTLENRLKMRTTIAVVISRVQDCVTQLESLYKVAGSSVDYLIVKNAFYGGEEDFRRYNDSAIRRRMFAEGNCICEIIMPELIEHAFDFIDENNLTFSDAMKAGKLSVEGRTIGWTKNLYEAMERAFPLLGFKN
ncbi:MAG: hypothetical protein AAFR83_17760 [Cyanobacteria bacterium J06629_18]